MDDMRSIAALLGAGICRQQIVPLHAEPDVRGLCRRLSPRQLRSCPRQLPAIYTPQLRDRVAKLYRRDVEQFDYDFDR
jgi:hypothetical protein